MKHEPSPHRNSGIDVSIVAPIYGGADSLPELQSRVAAVMQAAGLEYELLLVDDRGQAGAWRMIKRLSSLHPEIKGLRLGRNFGQHAATMCGIAESRGEWVVTLDDDLEHPPEAIPELLAKGNLEHPVVYGVFPRRTHAWYRNVSSEIMRWALKKAFPDLNANYTSFRAMHRSIADVIVTFGLSRPYIDGMVSWVTSNVATVEVTHGERIHGESTYTLKKLVSHALNIFVTFSQLPLRIATYTGTGLALLSFAWLIYVVYGRLSGSVSSPGYASLMSVVLFACGIQLIILGVLGEYVGRLMGATYRKPVYVIVDRTVGGSSAET